MVSGGLHEFGDLYYSRLARRAFSAAGAEMGVVMWGGLRKLDVVSHQRDRFPHFVGKVFLL